jgi:hypothetical protein
MQKGPKRCGFDPFSVLLIHQMPATARRYIACAGHQRSRAGLASWIAAAWYQLPLQSASLTREDAASVVALVSS